MRSVSVGLPFTDYAYAFDDVVCSADYHTGIHLLIHVYFNVFNLAVALLDRHPGSSPFAGFQRQSFQ